MAVSPRLMLLPPSRTFISTSYLAISVGETLYKSTIGKQAAIMSKLMNRHGKKKKFYSAELDLFPSRDNFGLSDKSSSALPLRRVSVLNKLFMKHITDIMATGSSCTNLIGWNIDITGVSVSNDYKFVTVYWLCPNFCADTLEEKLKEAGTLLRHDLCKLNLLGNIPRIIFVKDKRQLLINKVEHLLAKADMGNPNDLATESRETFSENKLPPMPTSVLGLNRAKIIEKIQHDSKKYRVKKKVHL